MAGGKNLGVGLAIACLLGGCGGSSGGSQATETDGETGDAPSSDTTTGGSGPVPTSSGSASTTPTTASTTSLPQGDGCCEQHAGPGCEEDAVEDCVCRTDASCCVFDWDMVCVNAALGPCGATCMPQMTGLTATTTDPTNGSSEGDGSSGTGVVDPGDCCMEQATPGCEVMSIETCVCALDMFCCNVMWDMMCIQTAMMSCGVVCP